MRASTGRAAAQPRLHAALDGRLDAPLLHDMLAAQGMERLSGTVAIEAEARGERELREPRQWRITARVSDATMPLGAGLPAAEKLAGTVRYSAGQLRGLELSGHWLGGPLEVESRRAAAGGAISFAVNGVADAAPLLRLLGQEEVAQRVSGQFAWTGSAQAHSGDGLWKVSLASNLGGVESHLPPPFDKRAHAGRAGGRGARRCARWGSRILGRKRPRARGPWPGARRRHQRAFRSAGRRG